MDIKQYIFYFPFLILAAVTFIVSIYSRSARRYVIFSCIFCICFFLVNISFLNPRLWSDLWIFRIAGLALKEGGNPYLDRLMVSPPTAFPLFWLLATVPPEAAAVIWTAVNIGLAVTLCLLSVRIASWDHGSLPSWSMILPPMSLFLLSFPVLWNMILGQLALLVSCALVGALSMRARGFPVIAGALLALSSIKPQTALPFLLIFARLKDVRLAVSAVGTMALLMVAVRDPTSLGQDVIFELQNIRTLSQEGEVNDFSFSGFQNHSIISLNYLLYCLGLTDRTINQVVGFAIVVPVGAALWIAWIRNHVTDAMAASLAALLSTVFLYHRGYDATILMLPIAYFYLAALKGPPRQRILALLGIFSLLPVLIIHPRAVQMVVLRLPEGGIARYAGEALLMPFATWSVIIGSVFMIALCREIGAGYLAQMKSTYVSSARQRWA